MSSYAITLNERTSQSQALLAYLRLLKVDIVPLPKVRRKNGLEESLDDVKHGRVYHAANVDDMFSQILGKDYVQH